MSFEWVTPGLLALLVAIVLWIALRRPPGHADAEREARDLRDEIARSAQGTRQEIVSTLGDFQRTLVAQQGDVARTQNELIDAFGRQLAATQQQLGASLGQATLAQVEQARLARDSLDQSLESQGARQAASLKDLSGTLSQQLEALVRANDQRMAEVRLAAHRAGSSGPSPTARPSLPVSGRTDCRSARRRGGRSTLTSSGSIRNTSS